MLLINKYLIICSAVLVLLISYTDAARSKRRKYCHANELLNCWEDLRFFSGRVNGSGLPRTEKEFDFYCGLQHVVLEKCARNWLKKCGNALHTEIFEQVLIKPTLESTDEFCDPKLNFKRDFLKEVPCLHSEVKMQSGYRSKCVKNIQAGFEWIQDVYTNNFTQQFQASCCVYNRWEKCIRDYITQECGIVKKHSIQIFIGSVTYHMLGQICRFDKFDPNGDLCLSYYQPKDMMPKGFKSNSYFSWIFSYECPSIGYGIVPEEDRLALKLIP